MPRNIIRKPAVRAKTRLSDTTIWRLERAGEFPARIQLTDAGAVGWVEAEVDAWCHDRIRAMGKRPPGVAPAKRRASDVPPANEVVS
jgi:prophage regulatory protein